MLFVPGGVLLLFLSLHAVHGIVWLMAESTRWMIGRMSHSRMRTEVLRALAHGRVLDGATLLHELRLFNGYSADLTSTKVYATLLGLTSAGLVQSVETGDTASGNVQWFTLTPQGERAAEVARGASREGAPRPRPGLGRGRGRGDHRAWCGRAKKGAPDGGTQCAAGVSGPACA